MNIDAYEERARERFLKSFRKSNLKNLKGCWLWIKVKEIYGYGIFWYKNSNRKAHRISWLFFRGEIPKGMVVCHSCDIRNCVNPDHLWLGTKADNNWDKIKKERHKFGEDHHESKFTNLERDDMAIRYRNGESQYSLAKKYRTLQTTVGYIVHSTYANKKFGIIPRKIIKKLTDQEKNEIARKYREGYTRAELMKHYNVCHDTIWKIVYSKKFIAKYGPILKINRKVISNGT